MVVDERRGNGVREILFRGMRTDGVWVYGSYVECRASWYRKSPHRAWIVTDARSNGGWFAINGRYAVINETVGQYAGVIDKNGRRVFDGDIVLTKYGRACRVEYRETPQFKGFDLTPVEMKGRRNNADAPTAWDLWDAENIEVIGNVYEDGEEGLGIRD